MGVPDFFKPMPGRGLVPVRLNGEEVTDIEGVQEMAERYALRHGFGHYVLEFSVPLQAGENPVSYQMNNLPTDWTVRYVTKGYVKVDPTPKALRNETTPFTWAQLGRAFPKAEEFFVDAAAHGLKDAVVVPWYGPRGARGSFSIITELTKLSDCDVHESAADALVFANYVFGLLMAFVLGDEDADVPILTDNQRELLGHLARGRDIKEIAKHLGIASISVRDRMKRAIARMGVRTREEALVRAVECGELYLLPPASEQAHVRSGPVRARG